MRTRATAAAGVLAAAAALAASEGIAALVDLRESPVLSVGQSVIALTPGPVAEAIIGVVGTKDKPLAVASVVVAILLLGGLVGRWWSTRRLAAFALVAMFVVLAVASVLTRPYTSPEGVFAAVAGGAVLMGVLNLLLPAHASEHADDAMSRRIFLRTAALVAVATVVVGGAGQVLASRHRRRQSIERLRASLKVPSRTVAAPAGTDLMVDGQEPWLTSNRDFYRIDTALSPPLIDPTEWSLRIHGMVDRELTLT